MTLKAELPIQESAAPSAGLTLPQLASQLIKARHDLHNSIGHILGFSEMLLEEVHEQGSNHLRDELEIINQTATRIMAHIHESLDPVKLQATLENSLSFERRFRGQTSQIVATAETL